MVDEARLANCTTKLSPSSKSPRPALESDCSTAQGSDRSSTRGSDTSDNADARSGFLKQVRKTEMCKYFLKGSCQWGANCNFAHGLSEIEESSGSCKMQTESAFKTTMCIWWKSKKGCRNGTDCQFAHGMKELRMNIDTGQLNVQDQKHTPQAILAACAPVAASTQAKAASVLGGIIVPPGLPPGLEDETSLQGAEKSRKDDTTSQLQILGSTVCTLMAQVNYLQQQLEERTAVPESAVSDITSQSAADRVTSHWQGGPSRKRRAFARARAHWQKLQQNAETEDELDAASSAEEEANEESKKGDRKSAQAPPQKSTANEAIAAAPSVSTACTPLKSNAKPFDPSSKWSSSTHAQTINTSWSRKNHPTGWNQYSWHGGYACT